ncbi:rod shape-determining protein RodA [Sphingomonas sp.]|uniref:rod shape-determining protein RodA n=1 Tax=Sphingomonas sp. TaxID=28214 RepID=UPI0026007102|nr:rod shape-determining protein RodA [Sphingomonas sp.]
MIGSAIIPRPLAKLPWRLIFMIVAIAGFGLVVLYSAAGGSVRPWALKQAMIFLFFLGLAISMSWLKESTIKAATFPIFALIVVMLIGVEALGLVKKGAQRWLELGPIRLQPSEFMKPAIVLTLARFYELLPAGEIRKWRAIWPALVLLGVPAFLILVQPDLGTCIMVVLCGITVMFLAGLPLYLFVGSGLTLAAAAPIAFSMMHDYQRKRVFIFMDPESDPLGAGYHISQSKIAIGSGGIWGKGFLQGSQSHLDYLPEGHTDFVFATMAEEWGLVGGVLLILAFGMVIRWGMRVSANAKSRFAQLTAAGLSMTIFFYVTINLMMVMGLAPVVGVPLPLVSFGGSAVMTIMLCLGILMALERQQRSQSRLE